MADVKAGGAFVELFVKSDAAVAGLQKFGGRLNRWGAQMQQAAAPVARAGVVAAAGYAGMMTQFAGFESAISSLRAKMRTASTTEFAELTDKAKQLGSTTRYSASEVAAAMNFLAMAGMDAGQILAAIEPTLNLATAGELDLAAAADIASDATSALGYDASETARVIDVMAVTVTSANTTIEMMGETFKYAAPLAKAMGQDVEDTAAAIGVLGNNGIKASVAGTDLAGIYKILIEKSGALASMGVPLEGADGKIRDLRDLMADYQAAIADKRPAEQLGLTQEMFGRHTKSVLVLASQIPVYDKLKAANENAAGAAQEMADVVGDNLEGDFLALKSAAESVAIALGETMTGANRSLIQSLTETTAGLQKWIKDNPGHVKSIMTLVAALSALAAIAVVVGSTLGTIGAIAVGLPAAFAGIAAVSSTVAGLSGALGAATVAGGVLAGLSLGYVIAQWVGPLADFNNELLKGSKLFEELKRKIDKRNDKALDEINAIDDDDARVAALEAELKRAEQAAAADERAVKQKDDRVDYVRENEAWTDSSKLIVAAEQEAKEARLYRAQSESYRDELKRQLQAAKQQQRIGGSAATAVPNWIANLSTGGDDQTQPPQRQLQPPPVDPVVAAAAAAPPPQQLPRATLPPELLAQIQRQGAASPPTDVAARRGELGMIEVKASIDDQTTLMLQRLDQIDDTLTRLPLVALDRFTG